MKLAAIAEALAYKGKPGWTPTDDAPMDIMGDRIQDEGQPKPQDIQALCKRAERQLLQVAGDMKALLTKSRQQNGWFQDDPGAEPPITDDPDGYRRREELTARLWEVIDRIWKMPHSLQEIRRRIGLLRDPEKLSDMYHTVHHMAGASARYLGEIRKVEAELPEVQGHYEAAMKTLKELSSTVEAVLRGTGMWRTDARYMGMALRPKALTKPKVLKW